MTDFEDDTGMGETYIVGKYFKVGTLIPIGMTGMIIKGRTITKTQIASKNLDDIISNAYILISRMVQKNGYLLLYDNFYWLEFYTASRFCILLNVGQSRVFWIFIGPAEKYSYVHFY